MKTAVLMSGQLRGFNHTHENIRTNILNQFPDPQVFYYGPPDPNGLVVTDYWPDAVVEIEEDDLSCAEGIVATGIGGASDRASHFNGHSRKKFVEHYALQFYGLYSAYTMMYASDEYYDIVVRLRPCTYTFDPMTFVEPMEKSLYIPNFDHYCGGINDKFAYGDFASMSVYCSFYGSDEMVGGYGGSENRILSYLINSGMNLCEIPQFTFASVNYDGSMRGTPNMEATPSHVDLSKWKKLISESYHTEFAMSHKSLVDHPEEVKHERKGSLMRWPWD